MRGVSEVFEEESGEFRDSSFDSDAFDSFEPDILKMYYDNDILEKTFYPSLVCFWNLLLY